MATDQQRRQRVASGSRRKRDLRAVGLVAENERSAERRAAEATKRAEREARLRPRLRTSGPSDAAWDAWAATHATLLADLRKPTFMLWLHPLDCLGEAENALCLSAPDHVHGWCERRYGRLIGETVRALSDFAGVYLLRAEGLEEGDVPL